MLVCIYGIIKYIVWYTSDHVNDDDVDIAIATMLESFINSQKHSVKMALRRTFRSYMVRPEDNYSLILYRVW